MVDERQQKVGLEALSLKTEIVLQQALSTMMRTLAADEKFTSLSDDEKQARLKDMIRGVTYFAQQISGLGPDTLVQIIDAIELQDATNTAEVNLLNDHQWIMILQLPEEGNFSKELVIGRYDYFADNDPDIDIRVDVGQTLVEWFNSQVSILNATLNLATRILTPVADASPLSLNDEIVSTSKVLKNGDVVGIGPVKLLIQFVPQTAIPERTFGVEEPFNLFMAKRANSSQDIAEIHSLLNDTVIEELNLTCPQWLADKVYRLANETKSTIGEALRGVLSYLETELGIKDVPDAEMINYYFPGPERKFNLNPHLDLG